MATLQRHCAKYIYVVPQGLRELMSDISREVAILVLLTRLFKIALKHIIQSSTGMIMDSHDFNGKWKIISSLSTIVQLCNIKVLRNQPEDLYTFIADYLDALIITRENGRVALSLVQNITEIAETTVNFLKRAGLTRAEANYIVGIIQARFREYLNRKHNEQLPDAENFTQQVLEEASMTFSEHDEVFTIIQEAYEQFTIKHISSKESLYHMVDWRLAAKATIALYRKTGVTKYEANRAATLIKAAYKGYYTRRVMKKLVSKGLMEEEEETFELEAEEHSTWSGEISSSEETVQTVSKGTDSTEAIQETHITEAEETQATHEISMDEEVSHEYHGEDEGDYIYQQIFYDVPEEILMNRDEVSPELIEIEESIAPTEETYTYTEQTEAYTEDTEVEAEKTEVEAVETEFEAVETEFEAEMTDTEGEL